jgi:putative ABC transport system permease protein
VGANTAVLAVTHGILIRPLPYRQAARLFILSVATPDGGDFGVPLEDVAEWRRRLRTVEALAGFATGEVRARGTGEPRLVQAAYVTEGFFTVLGVRPARGELRSFAEPNVAVLSERLAADLGDPAGGVAVGDCRCTLGAVLPEDFTFPSDQVGVWIAAGEGASKEMKFRVVARARPGVSPEQLAADAARVLSEIQGSAGPGAAVPRVTPLEDVAVGGLRPVLGASMAAALLVLLVTCGNVAMLLLGRAALRRRDSAVRLALGAGGWRLARGSLVESFLLAALGSLLGLGLAGLAVRVFVHAAAGVVPRSHAVALDPPVLAAGAATVFLVTLLCGAAPALHAARRNFMAAFRGGAAEEPRTRRALAALVVGQIAVAVVLLTGAALLARTVERLLVEETGTDPARTLVAKLPLGTRPGAGVKENTRLVGDLLARVRELPGVRHAGVGSSLPPAGLPFQIYVRVMARGRDEGRSLSVVSATPGFLEALGAQPVAGRAFESEDDLAEPRAVLLSESAARFAASDGLGQLAGRELPIRLPPIASFAGAPLVAGVVRDVKYAGLDQPAGAAVYLPWRARPAETAYLVLRTAGDPAAAAPAVHRILRELDPELPIPQIRTLEDEMALSIADRRLRVVPALGFAAVALGVALTGIFALLSRAAAERRREVAIRLALGASPSSIRRMVLRRAALLTGAGLAAGLAGSAAVTRGLQSLLFGVGPHDPLTFAAVVLLVSTASFLAVYLPARRAAAVEPLELLRSE